MQPHDAVIDTSLEPRRRPASHGWLWISEAFSLFRKQWRAWLGLGALFSIIVAVLSLHPLLSILGHFIIPILQGGAFIAADRAQRLQPISPRDVFLGFAPERRRELWRVGMFYLLGMLLVVILAGGLISLLFGTLEPNKLPNQQTLQNILAGHEPSLDRVLALVLISACMLAVYSAYLFAPLLVVLHRQRAGDAMKLSFLAFWRNWLPLLVSAICLGLLSLLIAIPLLASTVLLQPVAALFFVLGLLILLPVAILLPYTSYIDILGHLDKEKP